MNRLAYSAVCLSILLVLAGCGDRPVDESLLPTRVPPLDPNIFTVAAVLSTPEPTATPVPAATVEATTAPTPSDPPTATIVPTAVPTVELTVAPTVEPTVAPTVAVTDTVAVTASAPVPVTAGDAASAATELPAGVAAALAQADPMRGQQLTLSSGCIGCHSLDPNQVMPGPTWRNVAVTAATRVEGESAQVYLYNSIIHPNAYIVEGFQPNIMLQIYQDTLSEQNLADLIAYLLTLRGN